MSKQSLVLWTPGVFAVRMRVQNKDVHSARGTLGSDLKTPALKNLSVVPDEFVMKGLVDKNAHPSPGRVDVMRPKRDKVAHF